MRERRLIAEAILVVAATRIALWILPFGVVHRYATRAPRRPRSLDAKKIAATVAKVARRASCLTRVLAASIVLARHGHASTARIGIRDTGTGVEAHAWLEHNGRPILGDDPPPGTFVALH